MKNIPKNYKWVDIGEEARRQFINAQSVFTAWEEARKKAAQVRGGMYWKSQDGGEYLIRTSPTNEQNSLGPRSDYTTHIYEDFMRRKNTAEKRVSDLKAELELQQKMNRALAVGQAPQTLIDILQRLDQARISEYFTVVGTNALYAYESAAGVRFEQGALATNDVDLLWDISRRVEFVQHMKSLDTTLLGLLQKVDSTFELREGHRCTAVNNKGYEVDVIRREVEEGDPHPVRLTDHEDEFLPVQAPRSRILANAARFSSIVVSTTGRMARMNTIHPRVFANFKRWMADQTDRDTLKTRRDLLQAEIVEELVEEYLPHLSKDATSRKRT